jgi:hypothetical protein
MRSPVLFLVFNRPDATRQAFEAIRAARPPRLYVAADGPRPYCEGEAALCAEVRRIATHVDWPCKVETLFQDRNLGCMLGPFTGITWLFEREEEGIILEDDIVPVPTFFPYCDELLERFRDDERVGVISGWNPVSRYATTPHSYFFSLHVRSWGWASWRRAWRHYDIHMQAWPSWRDQGGLRSISDGNRWFESYWRSLFDITHRGGVDWWDYQWFFTCWYRGMLGVLPAHNQIRNIGFGPGATHTIEGTPAYMRESAPQPLSFPLQHPPRVERDVEADRLQNRIVFRLTLGGSLRRLAAGVKRRIRNTPLLGDSLKRVQRAFQVSSVGR